MTSNADGDFVYRPRVVVKFKDVPLPGGDSRPTGEIRRRPGQSEMLSGRYPDLIFEPLFDSPPPDEFRRMVRRAEQNDPTYQRPDFFTFFIVTVPEGVDPIALRDELARLDTVEYAYVKLPPAEPPGVNPGNNPLSKLQGYLDPAPVSIDAYFAWTQRGGDGSGQTLVDIERGWDLDHEDLRERNIDVFSGRNRLFIPHGTAVLGIIAAVDNHLGCLGIVPHIQSVRCASEYRDTGNIDTQTAITDAIAVLTAGDVILLEVQAPPNKYPAEYETPVFEAVRLATASGITVVACAGNGAQNLDMVTVEGKFVFDRNSPDFRDSGAIFVGSGTWEQRVRTESSNYGNRIDCFAWGENVATTYSNDEGTNHRRYTNCANGTSTAGAIIAGAAVSAQGVAQARFDARYQPPALRALLSHPTNTHSENNAFDRIGVMPDLRNIILNLMTPPPGDPIRRRADDVAVRTPP